MRPSLIMLIVLVLLVGILTTSPVHADRGNRDDWVGRDDRADRDEELESFEHAGEDALPLDPEPELDVALALLAPPIGEVLGAAYAVAGFDRDPTPSWSRRARVAGLVPWVTVRTGWDASWKDDDPEVGRGRTFEVRATWRLDRLLFDGRELQIASVSTARRRERGRLASRVIRTYFQWRRTASAALRSSRWQSRADEAAAELDALTDGWFSEHLSRSRRSASETRTSPQPRRLR